MAQHRIDYTKGPEVVDAGMNLVHLHGALRLRQRNNNGEWTPYGSYGVGNIRIGVWSPKAHVALTGFVAEMDVVGQDKILFRLSPDGGTTPMWWNGTAWVAAIDPVDDWNPEDVIDAHIATFPIGTGVTQIARFISFDGTTTPRLIGTSIYYEVEYDPTYDLLDSLARALAAGVRVNGAFQKQVPVAPAPPSNMLTIDDPLWVVNDPVRVYNETTDPNKRVNLFVSRVGNVLTLAAPQTGLLTVHYKGSVALDRIHIATDADVEKAELPAIVLQTPTSTRVRFENTSDDYEELLRSLNVLRRRKSATFEDVRVHVQCNAAWDLHGRKLRDVVRAFIEEKLETLQSRALDERLVRTSVGSFVAMHDLAEQTATFDLPAVFSVLNWPGEFTDFPVAKEVELKVWPQVGVDSPKDEEPFSSIRTVEIGAVGPLSPLAELAAQLEFAEVSFNINTPTPEDFYVIPAGYEILQSEVVIETAFNDPGALIALGLVSSPGNIFATDAIDPQMAGEYVNDESFLVADADALRLQVFAGASTQGSGRVVVTLRRR